MKCLECQHENVSDFPFCEVCLELLPSQSDTLAFDLSDYEGNTAEAPVEPSYQPFAWNPPGTTDTLIGREKAIEELLEGWDVVRKTWTGRIQLLVGESGMGKGRVGAAVGDEAKRREPDARVVRVECPQQGGAYRMWDAVLRQLFDIPPLADGDVAVGRIELGLIDYLPEQATQVASLVGQLVGYKTSQTEPLTGAAAVGPGSGALVRLLATMAYEPLIIVIDRANRSTRESMELAAVIEAALKGKPVMIVLVGSPELKAILPGWDRFPTTHLKSLKKADGVAMVRHFLSGLGGIPQDLVERIVERSSGNPSAIKSLIQYLREADGIRIQAGQWVLDEALCWELELPDDLEAVALARLNRLTAHERSILGHAAVVGKEFWLGCLMAMERQEMAIPNGYGSTVKDGLRGVIGKALEKLDAQRFVERRPTSIPGETAWAFRSDVHWRLAESIVPEASRPAQHAVVRQWLHLVDDSETASHLAELARHAELAGEEAKAAGYMWRAAGAEKAQLHPDEAFHLLQRAHTLAAADDQPTRLGIAFDLGDARADRGDTDGALVCYQEALHLAWQLVHRAKGAKALLRIGQVETGRGDFEAASRHFEGALRLYEAVDDSHGVAKTCIDLGRMLWLGGRLDEAEKSYRKSEELYTELSEVRGLATTADARASLCYDRGDLDLAQSHYERALKLRREAKDLRGVAATLNNLGAVFVGKKEPIKAIKGWKEALDIVRSIGFRRLEVALVANLGEGLMSLGRLDEAETLFSQAESFTSELDDPRSLADIALNRASVRMLKKDWPGANKALKTAKALANKLDLPRISAQVEREYGDYSAGQADRHPDQREKHTKKAARHFRKAIKIYSEAGYDLEAAASHEHLADLFEAASRKNEADAERSAAEALRAEHAP